MRSLARIAIPMAYIILIMGIIQSMCTALTCFFCRKPLSIVSKTVSELLFVCDYSHPHLLTACVIAYGLQSILGILAVCGFAFRKKYLILAWIITDILFMSRRFYTALFLSAFYPDKKFKHTFAGDHIYQIYMNEYLYLAADLLSWILNCVAYDKAFTE